ncbi:PIN domain-containing protein [Streptomyces sp. NRRL S-475]|uniref:PIN domain-containing protein n=1 Tax=Streptomyces sp. NRRL S-475 TaxID=1463910 RepID=UPI00131E5381|nr:PIN domain-containing protein [Streptomyces sp. NRRL S-475]
MSTFLKGFEGYTRRPATEYKSAVRGYLVSVDTNVLLELYRFTPEARNEFLEVLRKLGDRLWVPHQVVREYFDRRVGAVKEHLELYSTIPDALMGHKNKTLDELNRFAKRCSLSSTDRLKLTKPIEEAFESVATEVARRGREFDLSLESMIADDHVLSTLAEILDGRTGNPFSEEEESEALNEFGKRVASKRPPGYKDAGKDDNAHGDYFVWEQLLRHAATTNNNVLFVTNDAKEDWVRKQSGFIVGARPELIAEFTERCQSDFLLTQLGPFLRTAKEELGVAISPSTVAQAENLEASRESKTLSLPATLYSAAIDVLEGAKVNAKNDIRRARISTLINDAENSVVRDDSRVYVRVPSDNLNDFQLAIRQAHVKQKDDVRKGENQAEQERKLDRVRRRFANASAEYERSCTALDQAAEMEEAATIREVLQAAKNDAEGRMRVLSRRLKELESAIYTTDHGDSD